MASNGTMFKRSLKKLRQLVRSLLGRKLHRRRDMRYHKRSFSYIRKPV